MKIITISRKFGSGGRELGKPMADILGCAYYDKKIVEAIAKESNLNEGYIENLVAVPQFLSYPIAIGRTFSHLSFIRQNEIKILIFQQRVLKALAAQGDCIIMG